MSNSYKAYTYEEVRARHKVDEERVLKIRDEMIAISRSYRLAEFRKAMKITQSQLAEKLEIRQSNVSRIEHGKFEKVSVKSLQSYIEALGGTLEIRAIIGDQAITLIDSVK